jgi:hypothetical protein
LGNNLVAPPENLVVFSEKCRYSSDRISHALPPSQLLRPGSWKDEIDGRRLKAGSFFDGDRTVLPRTDVSIAILGQVGNDCLGGPVSTQPGVLVIEDVLAVSHQILTPVLLEDVDAVFFGLEQAVEFEIPGVVVTGSVVEDDPRLLQDPELAEIPPEPTVQSRVGRFATIDGKTLARPRGREGRRSPRPG